MNILLVVPHKTLLTPQGHLVRLGALLDLLSEKHNIWFLIPRGSCISDAARLPSDRVAYFDEPALGPLSIPYFIDWSPKFRTALGDAAARAGAGLIIYDFPWGLRIGSKDTALPAVYFSHGVEGAFAPIALSRFAMNFFPFNMMFSLLISAIEKRACRASKLIITMSQSDSSELSSRYGVPEEKMYALRQPVAPAALPPADRGAFGLPADKTLVLFHGSYAHPPNRSAIKSLEQHIAPAVAGLMRDVQFVIAGPGVPEYRSDTIHSLGFVDELEKLISCTDIGLLPIYEGCGVKMKIFDYLRAGLPTVATSKAVQGLDVVSGRELVVVPDNPDAAAASVMDLIQQDSIQRTLSENALRYIQEKHDFFNIQKEFLPKLEAVV